jgi:hypothetical protein
MAAVTSAQPGIFALGTTDHSYLEFDLLTADAARDAVAAAVGVVEELPTTGGVNVVIGVRPSVWPGSPTGRCRRGGGLDGGSGRPGRLQDAGDAP